MLLEQRYSGAKASGRDADLMHTLNIARPGCTDVGQQMRQRGADDLFKCLFCRCMNINANGRSLACLRGVALPRPHSQPEPSTLDDQPLGPPPVSFAWNSHVP